MSSAVPSHSPTVPQDRHLVQVKQHRNSRHPNPSGNRTCVPQTDSRHQTTKMCTPDNVIRTALDPCMLGGMGLGCAGGWV